MRVVHFSDIHLCLWPEQFYRALFDKRILGLINYALRRRGQMHREFLGRALETIAGLRPQLVVCTGDIASVGSEREFKRAEQSLQPLIDNPQFDFIYVPGNHDHYVRDHHCQRFFHDTFKRLNRNRWQIGDLPLTVTIDHHEFMLCDECRPTNIYLSSGDFAPCADFFRRWLDQPRDVGVRRILLGHYPTRDRLRRPLSRRRRLNHGVMVLDALRDGRLDVSLCGHIHSPFVHREASGGWEICAGSLTVKGMVNVLDIPDPGKGEIRQQWISV